MPKAYKKPLEPKTVVLEMSVDEAARLTAILGASTTVNTLPLFEALHEEVPYHQWHPYYLEEKK